jgi:hypothetical protein
LVTTTDWSGVRDRIAALRDHPRHDQVYGSSGHHFILAQALSSTEVSELQSWLGVTLPADYRDFLTDVAAGGAGPFYGVLPVRRAADGWEWHGDGGDLTDMTRLADAFPTVRIPDDALDELVAERPRENDFASEAELDAAFDVWDARLEALLYQPDMSVGAICLADEGGAYRDWLVVSGPARGTMWEDPRCIDQDFKPMHVSFGDWYLAWLTDCERLMDGVSN